MPTALFDRKSKARCYLERDNKCWEVAEAKVERDLGIWVSNDLKWETQSRLGYCIWKKDINCMEKVQHKETKMVYGFGNIKYEERLERLNLFSLQYRRIRENMIETYKIISVLEDINLSQLFTSWTISVDTAWNYIRNTSAN